MRARPTIATFACCVVGFVFSFSQADEPLRNAIDQHVETAWKAQGVTPAERATDAEFLRRVYLDLLGTIPSYDEAIAFLDETAADKREKLVDRLLAHPRFGLHQADVWDMIYFGRNPPGYGTDQRDGFQKWLGDQFNANVPYDQWVRQILKAEGNSAEQGPPMFFVQYSNQPEEAAEAVAQKFLGVQLQCARCHDHPFESWSQLDFYGMASFFARLRVVDIGDKQISEEKKLKAFAIGEMNTGDVLFAGPAAELEPGKKGEPVKPKFLAAEALQEPELPADVKDPNNFPGGQMPPAPVFSRKNALADWITSANNPYFARAAVNRIWAQYLGKGIVHPVDNLSTANPPSHPELLDSLSQSFVAHSFDVKWLTREIVMSRTYQLAANGPATEAKPLWYERARYRPLSAEELLESWIVAVGFSEMMQTKGETLKGRFQIPNITWDYVRRFFGEPNDGVENFKGGLQEHLYLNNGQVHQLITEQKGGLFDVLMTSELPWEARVERLYVQTLSRRPSPAETEKFLTYLTADEKQTRTRLREAIWSLISCSEFRFNH